MLRRIFKLNRAYREAKEQAFEESINEIETNLYAWVAVFPFAIIMLLWLGATTTPIGAGQLYESFGFSPVIVIFVTSYLTFFLGSKIVFKPTKEETHDDTSMFALFSAYSTREYRSLISIGLAVLHTLILVLYLISKDPNLLDPPK